MLGTAAAARLITGPAYLGYDAVWALIWGRQMASGELPSFELEAAPTPHPLANAAGALLAPLGQALATDVALALVYLSLGGLAWACWRLGRAVAGVWVAGLFALLAVSRPVMLVETAQALIDIPFLWLVVWALALEVRSPRRGAPVVVLLLLAGLLRPEAWLLSGAYALWLMTGRAGWAARARTAAAAAAAPVVWMLFDLAVTGDPLYSLHGTQALAADLQRPREFDTALAATPFYLRQTLGAAVMWIGLAGVLAAVMAGFDEALAVLAAAGLGMLAFLVLGVSDLPLLTRYLLLPAVVIALFTAVALLGWTRLEREDPWRRRWAAAGGVLGLLLLASLPGEADRLDGAADFTRARAAIQRDLERLTRRPEVAAALGACEVVVPDHRPAALLAWWLDLDPERVVVATDRLPASAAFVAYADPRAAAIFSLEQPPPEPGLPGELEAIDGGPIWLVGSSC